MIVFQALCYLIRLVDCLVWLTEVVKDQLLSWCRDGNEEDSQSPKTEVGFTFPSPLSNVSISMSIVLQVCVCLFLLTLYYIYMCFDWEERGGWVRDCITDWGGKDGDWGRTVPWPPDK